MILWSLAFISLSGRNSSDGRIKFFNAETEKDLKVIGTKNPGIQEAMRELKRLSPSNPLRLR